MVHRRRNGSFDLLGDDDDHGRSMKYVTLSRSINWDALFSSNSASSKTPRKMSLVASRGPAVLSPRQEHPGLADNNALPNKKGFGFVLRVHYIVVVTQEPLSSMQLQATAGSFLFVRSNDMTVYGNKQVVMDLFTVMMERLVFLEKHPDSNLSTYVSSTFIKSYDANAVSPTFPPNCTIAFYDKPRVSASYCSVPITDARPKTSELWHRSRTDEVCQPVDYTPLWKSWSSKLLCGCCCCCCCCRCSSC
jgi:hypothetical protein